MSQPLKSNEVDDLFKAILSLKNIDDCYKFFEDLLTINELKSLSQRFAVAKLLTEKKTYDEITAKTGASTATISRVKKFLEYGADGYKKAIKNTMKD